MRTVVKRTAEWLYWLSRRLREPTLANTHYEYFFTTHFGLTRADYAGCRVLDVGCGPRGSLEWASEALERVGLDPLARSYRAFGTRGHAMRYVAAPAEHIPFPAGYFDIVSTFNALDHVENVDQAIAELIRVLRPGGLLLLLTDVNHRPTVKEPVAYSWDVLDKFCPPLTRLHEARFEKSGAGMYDSLHASIPYDEADPRQRYGLLSALLRKPDA